MESIFQAWLTAWKQRWAISVVAASKSVRLLRRSKSNVLSAKKQDIELVIAISHARITLVAVTAGKGYASRLLSLIADAS